MATDLVIVPSPSAWIVRADGAILAETRRAIELREGDGPPVVFIPREDVAMAFFEPSPTRTASPRMGAACHFSYLGRDGAIRDAAWSYEAPEGPIAGLAGHLAFREDGLTVQRA
jgi:uncharacterized protein (DUF427 family)